MGEAPWEKVPYKILGVVSYGMSHIWVGVMWDVEAHGTRPVLWAVGTFDGPWGGKPAHGYSMGRPGSTSYELFRGMAHRTPGILLAVTWNGPR